MVEERNKCRKSFNRMIGFILIFIVSSILFYVENILCGLLLLISGAAFILINFARSGEDEVLDTRTNYELVTFYTKAAYFLLVILGATLLIFVTSQYILSPILEAGYKG